MVRSCIGMFTVLFVTCFLCLVLVSCGGGEDSEDQESSFVGRWAVPNDSRIIYSFHCGWQNANGFRYSWIQGYL